MKRGQGAQPQNVQSQLCTPLHITAKHASKRCTPRLQAAQLLSGHVPGTGCKRAWGSSAHL